MSAKIAHEVFLSVIVFLHRDCFVRSSSSKPHLDVSDLVGKVEEGDHAVEEERKET